MHFDMNVNLGNVITAVGLLIGLAAAHLQNIRKLQDIETKLGMIYTWFIKAVVDRDTGDR